MLLSVMLKASAMYLNFLQQSKTALSSFLGMLSLFLVGATLVALYIKCDSYLCSFGLKNRRYIAIPQACSPASANPCNSSWSFGGIFAALLKMYRLTLNFAASFISFIHLSQRFLISSGSSSSHPRDFSSSFL